MRKMLDEKLARFELLEKQLDVRRLEDALRRIESGRVTIMPTERASPLAFPLMVERLRERLSSEKLADRVRRMQTALEKAS